MQCKTSGRALILKHLRPQKVPTPKPSSPLCTHTDAHTDAHAHPREAVVVVLVGGTVIDHKVGLEQLSWQVQVGLPPLHVIGPLRGGGPSWVSPQASFFFLAVHSTRAGAHAHTRAHLEAFHELHLHICPRLPRVQAQLHLSWEWSWGGMRSASQGKPSPGSPKGQGGVLMKGCVHKWMAWPHRV